MSHITTVTDIIFTDVKALKTAAQALKKEGIDCKLLTDSKPRAFYDNQMEKAPFVLSLKNSRYDVGFYMTKEGNGYIAKADFFGGEIEKQIGVKYQEGMNKNLTPMSKLYAQYTVAATVNEAVSKGYSVQRSVKSDGSIQLRIGVN
jgi:hypothetical protein